MRYALIREMDISNGPGIRASLFVQGCHFHCKGCFNQETWDFKGGISWDKQTEDYFVNLCKGDHITGISILGGEPLDQGNELLKLIRRLKKEIPGKEIWLWTGFIINQIPVTDTTRWDILKEVDTVIDGQFMEENHKFDLQYYGSTNQRVLSKKQIESIYNVEKIRGENHESSSKI